jgi:two-component system phosphate regulon sensor histidine kinase PhoR
MNDVHFTNVIVNVLENAIKYSPDVPDIDVYTENIKDMILIKVQDKGLGMSKVAQKRVLKSLIENTLEIYIMLKVMV